MMRAPTLLLLGSLLALSACDNAGQDLDLPDLPTGGLGVAVYVDRDGTGTFTTFDTTFAGARVAIFGLDGLDTLLAGATSPQGQATFTGVPIGRYGFAVVPGSVGDSLPEITILGPGTLRITAQPGSTFASSSVLVSHPTLTLAEVRSATIGRRVFVRGVVTSPLQFFPDSATYLRSGASALRVIPSAHWPGRAGNNPGDSVIVVGTVGRAGGQPVLTGGRVLTVGTTPVPAPIPVTAAELPGARNGELDAALVVLDSVAIADTATVPGFYVMRVEVGGDTATIRADSLLLVPKAFFVPGRGLRVRGVLVPDGNGTWYLRPRPVNGEFVVLN
jgi:hypothetical protein